MDADQQPAPARSPPFHDHWLTRAEAEREVSALAADAFARLVQEYGLKVANVSLVARHAASLRVDGNGVIAQPDGSATCSGSRGSAGRRHLAQLWAVLAAVHSSMKSGRKMTQRELWYRLKTSGLFANPQQVNDRVLDACAAISCRSGVACPRETLGVIAAPRGSITGCISFLGEDDALQPLDEMVWQIPGDTSLIRELRIAADSRARCVLVVEKDSVFRRLHNDGLHRRLPRVLITVSSPGGRTRAGLRAWASRAAHTGEPSQLTRLQ